MLHFQRRCGDVSPIGSYPGWFSALLRQRGITTEAAAEAFLHPSVDQLHDPFLMQDMDRAVTLIRNAIASQQSIVIYGDYDVDGVCSTSVLMDALREAGAKVSFRIPSRHQEGYGLNANAIRELALTHQLLITVDCGITNHEEVKLARSLGMTVIVTDHHQLADTPSPADAVLNPLLGEYPFRRLCGAGVALKLVHALFGMDAMRQRIDLAAVATVADIVPLIDENRVIVTEGLKRINAGHRLGLQMLLAASNTALPISSEAIGFRIGPRINAGGRLMDATVGVQLLLSADQADAQRYAQTLNSLNEERQETERRLLEEAAAAMDEQVDLRTDRCIIVMGENWNSGVIGLAAGRLCERYHFPVIVLSRSGDTAVGSCRSIPGVNIHKMLSLCKDLFERFGGHEQAAGLTIRTEFVPELRRRLNLAIREHCDEACFVPVAEYDLPLTLRQVDSGLIDRLQTLEPTGYGNPAPQFLLSGATLQEARAVGRDFSHLKLTLEDGGVLRGGIAFGKGEMANKPLHHVDAVFVPSLNTFHGSTSVQVQIRHLQPSAGSIALPDDFRIAAAILQDFQGLVSKNTSYPEALSTINETRAHHLLQQVFGTLVLTRSRATAAAFAQDADVVFRETPDPRGFSTLLICPDAERLTDLWQTIVLADGDLLPGEAALLKARCPHAELVQMKPDAAWSDLLDACALSDDRLREAYIALRRPGVADLTVDRLAETLQLQPLPMLVALRAFEEVRLIQWGCEPWHLQLLPPVRCSMESSPTLHYLRSR